MSAFSPTALKSLDNRPMKNFHACMLKCLTQMEVSNKITRKNDCSSIQLPKLPTAAAAVSGKPNQGE
jgi:hypothetical protein